MGDCENTENKRQSFSNSKKDDQIISDEDFWSIINQPEENRIPEKKEARSSIDRTKGNVDHILPACYFCKKNPSQDSACLVVDLFKLVKVRCTGFSVRGFRYGYYTRQVEVPRCDECKSYHDRREKWAVKCIITGGICAAALGVFIGLLAISGLTRRDGFEVHYLLLLPVMGIAVGMWGLIVGAIINLLPRPRLRKGIRARSYEKKFPSVKSALEQGWKLGEQPRKEYKAVHMGRIAGTEEIPNDK